MELQELENHFSPADGWQCDYCMDIVPCDTKAMNAHLDSCKPYQEQHQKENSSNPSKCPKCDEKTLENFDRVCTYCSYEEIVS